MINIEVGAVYGKLTVIGETVAVKNSAYRSKACMCRCECGVEKPVSIYSLVRGAKSCGCLFQINGRTSRTKHGLNKTPMHYVWVSLRSRCNKEYSTFYANYGGRGITVCEEWDQSFLAFKLWADESGYSPGLQIDRVDNDGDYTPDNCRWVTARENSRNRRSNRPITAFGETKLLQEWFEDRRCAVLWKTLHDRLGRGWKPEEAISKPPIVRNWRPGGKKWTHKLDR